jgi:Uma2 family endonuclease
MSAAKTLNLISVEDYLAGELVSPVKHEYLGGVAFAMSGARVVHDVIAVNILGSLFGRLRGRPCRPYSPDMKIRLRLEKRWRFYYPDTSVVCRSNPAIDSFQDEPEVIFEVLSKGTRRIDEGEKKDAYLTIPSLKVYALVEQEFPAVTIFRRKGDEFVREVVSGLDAALSLPEIETELPLREIYDRVEFRPEESDDDEQEHTED